MKYYRFIITVLITIVAHQDLQLQFPLPSDLLENSMSHKLPWNFRDLVSTIFHHPFPGWLEKRPSSTCRKWRLKRRFPGRKGQGGVTGTPTKKVIHFDRIHGSMGRLYIVFLLIDPIKIKEIHVGNQKIPTKGHPFPFHGFYGIHGSMTFSIFWHPAPPPEKIFGTH